VWTLEKSRYITLRSSWCRSSRVLYFSQVSDCLFPTSLDMSGAWRLELRCLCMQGSVNARTRAYTSPPELQLQLQLYINISNDHFNSITTEIHQKCVSTRVNAPRAACSHSIDVSAVLSPPLGTSTVVDSGETVSTIAPLSFAFFFLINPRFGS
jgi:hypothetical protein